MEAVLETITSAPANSVQPPGRACVRCSFSVYETFLSEPYHDPQPFRLGWGASRLSGRRKPRITRLSNRMFFSGRRSSLNYLTMQTGAEQIGAKYGPEKAVKIIAECKDTQINSQGKKVFKVLSDGGAKQALKPPKP